MRFIFAFLLGIVVTIGGAFYHDATLSPAERTAGRLVNWDTLGELSRWSVERAQDEFKRLTAK